MEVTLGWCRPLLAPVLLATALTALAGNGPDRTRGAERTILIHTEAGIRVDATGHVEAVELDPQLPASLREHLGRLIHDWTFSPVMRDGRAVGGKTYADLDLCLVPSGDHFNVGLGFVGTGPGDATSDGRAQAPPFPSSLLGKRMNVDGRIRYRVGGDGRAELVSATLDDPALASRHERTWRRQVRKWLRKRRFKPEVIDGQPTATTMELPVQYRLIPMDATDEPRRRVAQQLADAEACRTAGIPAERREVAMDSRFVLLPEAGIR